MKFLQFNIKYARFLGYWHLTDNPVYKAYTLCQLAFVILFGCSQIMYILTNESTFKDILHIIVETVVTFLTVYRIIAWMFQEKLISEMMTFLKVAHFNETHPIILRGHKIAFFYSCFLFMYPYTSIFLTFAPTVHKLVVDNSYENVKLPFHNWVPFDTYSSSRNFAVAMIYQIHGYWICVASICVIHSTLISLMVKISAHFELLAEEISKIDGTAVNAEMELNHYIQEYHNIFMFAKTIGNVNSIQWIGQLLPQAYMLCSSLILTASTPASEAGGDIFLGASCLFDLFVYCWFGEQITYQSNRITLKLWEINWDAAPLKFRKKFLSSMIIFGRGITFKVGGFFILRLQSYVQILRLTYSMYTVLNKFSH